MKVGFISVRTHPVECRVARVRVDGVDVSRRCYAADDVAGFADCFRVDGRGRVIVDRDRKDLQRERLRGQVVIDFPKGLD